MDEHSHHIAIIPNITIIPPFFLNKTLNNPIQAINGAYHRNRTYVIWFAVKVSFGTDDRI
jgi:hypothetical protein